MKARKPLFAGCPFSGTVTGFTGSNAYAGTGGRNNTDAAASTVSSVQTGQVGRLGGTDVCGTL